MSPILESVFPRTISNDYRGSPVALWLLWLLMIPYTFRSIVHTFWEDGGLNAIATIIVFTGDPDPNRVLYLLGSLWGGQQLVFTILLGIVLLRYRTMIPIMCLLIIAESLLRTASGAMHPLTPEYYSQTPPGSVAAHVSLAVGTVALGFSVLRRGSVLQADTAVGESHG